MASPCPEWFHDLRCAEGLPADYEAAAHAVIEPLADKLAILRRSAAAPVIVGICGAQGSGKTTLARFLEAWLRREQGLGAATVALDDCYLTRSERQQLARSGHPLLRTRGVPGTHDVGLCARLLDELVSVSGNVSLPRFDKALDDRAPESTWPAVETPVDVVLFEGWCIGTRPQQGAALEEPVNELEAVEDADGQWRRYVNDRLATDYAALFGRLDALVLMRVPSFDKVLEWRGLQERKLTGRVDHGQMLRFVQHFERLTRHTLETMPAYADAAVDIDEGHRLGEIDFHG
jgi:D-glycerate 3-kinase